MSANSGDPVSAYNDCLDRADAQMCECGHPIDEHADSGWGPRAICTHPSWDPDGWHDVCPCVRRDV